jgi:hypothetical protein
MIFARQEKLAAEQLQNPVFPMTIEEQGIMFVCDVGLRTPLLSISVDAKIQNGWKLAPP